jgi:hypothetical protein
MDFFMKKIIPLFLFFISLHNISAQGNSINGLVVDSLSSTPLYGASVTLSSTNNVLLGGIATDSKGKFFLDRLGQELIYSK